MTVWPESHVTNGLWAHKPNLVKIHFALICKMMIWSSHNFCTCHDSWAVMACANLWLDWIIKIKIKENSISIRFQLGTKNCLWNRSWPSMSTWAMSPRICKSRLAESRVMLFGFHICPLPTCWQLIYVSAIPLSSCPIWHRGVTIHLAKIRFILR